MTIKQIEAEGFKVRQVMSKLLIVTDKNNLVYFANRFQDHDKHFSRPIKIGSAKRGFVKFMKTKGLDELTISK